MNLKEAKKITGGLSSPSKMPGYAYNLPAWRCITGVKLQAVEGSVCAGCYAMKGRYRFPNVKDALNRRLNSLTHPKWISAMAFLITHYSKKQPWFRWHDSGDLQGIDHLKNIFMVCNLTSWIQHWMPTREVKILKGIQPEIVPKNPLAAIAACAGPPRNAPVRLRAIFNRVLPAPVASSIAPKMMNINMSDNTMMTINPNTPSKLYQTVRKTDSRS